MFTAERIAYRNLLDGYEPDEAATVGNPFQDWIGAQIRTDVYGWVCPGDPSRAAALAWQDGRLSHRRNGLYGAMFVAAATSAAVVARDGRRVHRRRAVGDPAAVALRRRRCGVASELADGDLDDEAALDVLYAEFGHLHWVHVAEQLGADRLRAHAQRRRLRRSDHAPSSRAAGTPTPTARPSARSAERSPVRPTLPGPWIDPLANRLATTIAGFDGIGFDELARRTVAARLS